MNFENSLTQVPNPNTYPNSLSLSVVLPNSCFQVKFQVAFLQVNNRVSKLILFPTELCFQVNRYRLLCYRALVPLYAL